jgi:type I restriction enzyme M protein
VWILRNKKDHERKNKVQLIDAKSFFVRMKKCLGEKRNEITPEQISKILDLYKSFKENDFSRILDTKDFGYTRVTLELCDLNENGLPLTEMVTKKVNGKKIEFAQEKKTKDEEYIPLKEDIAAYLKKEVDKPYKILKQDIGYEINFDQYFFKYEQPRPFEEIAEDIMKMEKENQELIKKLGIFNEN